MTCVCQIFLSILTGRVTVSSLGMETQVDLETTQRKALILSASIKQKGDEFIESSLQPFVNNLQYDGRLTGNTGALLRIRYSQFINVFK